MKRQSPTPGLLTHYPISVFARGIPERRYRERRYRTAWPSLNQDERVRAARELGSLLRALHQMCAPLNLRNSWLDDTRSSGGPRGDAYHAPPTRYRDVLDAAQAVPGIDRGVRDAVGAFIAERLDAFPREPNVLVHADVHFANILWHNRRIGALLDFKSARPAPPDQALDTLRRFVREPRLYDWTAQPDK